MRPFFGRVSLTFITLFSLLSCSGNRSISTRSESREKSLTFREGFSLLLLNDLDWSALSDIDHQKDYLRHLIAEAKINADHSTLDLIFLNGNSFYRANKKVVKQLLSSLEDSSVPFAINWGNDDRQGDYRYSDLLEALSACPHALYSSSKEAISGSNDFVIRLDENGTPRFALFALDSNGYDVSGVPLRYAASAIKKEQVDWLEEEAKNLALAPALGFTSTAPKEFARYVEEKTYTKLSFEQLGAIETPEDSSPLLERIQTLNFKGFFFGHDHPNDFVMDVSGISLGYGVKSSTEKGYATSSARTYLSGGKEKSLQILGGSLYKLQQSGAFSLEHLYLQDDEAYTLVKERH